MVGFVSLILLIIVVGVALIKSRFLIRVKKFRIDVIGNLMLRRLFRECWQFRSCFRNYLEIVVVSRGPHVYYTVWP